MRVCNRENLLLQALALWILTAHSGLLHLASHSSADALLVPFYKSVRQTQHGNTLEALEKILLTVVSTGLDKTVN